jgi:integrase
VSCEDKHHPHKPQFCRWHAPAWRFLANTGLSRRKEAMQLRKAWLRRDALQNLSTSEERTKSGKWREIPRLPRARDALDELDAILGADREFILPRITLPSMSRAAAKCIDARRAVRAGFTPSAILTLAIWRWTRTSPSAPFRQWAGHSSIATTELYMYLRDKGRPWS